MGRKKKGSNDRYDGFDAEIHLAALLAESVLFFEPGNDRERVEEYAIDRCSEMPDGVLVSARELSLLIVALDSHIEYQLPGQIECDPDCYGPELTKHANELVERLVEALSPLAVNDATTLVQLSPADLDMLTNALDSHVYWTLSEPEYRNSGYVLEDGETPEILEAYALSNKLHGHRPREQEAA